MAIPRETSIDEHPTEDEERVVRKGVSTFGDQYTAPRNWQPVRLVVRCAENGRVIGGLLGSTVWDWLQIDVLSVAEDKRGQGYGRALIQRAEEIALERGCPNARVDTF